MTRAEFFLTILGALGLQRQRSPQLWITKIDYESKVVTLEEMLPSHWGRAELHEVDFYEQPRVRFRFRQSSQETS